MATRRWALVLAAFALTASAIEAVAYLGCAVLQRRGYFFYEPADVSFGMYLRVRDPILGWSVGHSSDMVWDQIGSRVIPFAPNPFTEPPLVSLYGDSWTWSWPVASRDAYSNVLAERLGVRVNNFGICGYGTDQAYLRYVGNKQDRAPVVVLGVLSENILRNVCSFLDLINPAGGYGLKPRFVLDAADHLRLRPPLGLDHGNFSDFLAQPEELLQDEYFKPIRRDFPFTGALLRAASGFQFRAAVQGLPRWAEFYRPDHPTRSLQITTEIIAGFATEAKTRGQRPLIALFPMGEDLRFFEAHGRWIYQPLIDEILAREIDICHVGPAIVEAMGGRDFTELFTDNDLAEHPNVAGYALQAEIVHRCVLAKGLLDSELHAHALAQGEGDDHGEHEEDDHPGELPLEAEAEEVH